ncbi:hypothetical protein WJX73_008736 [Symbiochloris irregularis]|uniref:Uncharacterized protein n=1 Tax=Symbiochloris irregularis TaxID=706552 RepID=A0AAW1PC39_9CHLO
MYVYIASADCRHGSEAVTYRAPQCRPLARTGATSSFRELRPQLRSPPHFYEGKDARKSYDYTVNYKHRTRARQFRLEQTSVQQLWQPQQHDTRLLTTSASDLMHTAGWRALPA